MYIHDMYMYIWYACVYNIYIYICGCACIQSYVRVLIFSEKLDMRWTLGQITSNVQLIHKVHNFLSFKEKLNVFPMYLGFQEFPERRVPLLSALLGHPEQRSFGDAPLPSWLWPSSGPCGECRGWLPLEVIFEMIGIPMGKLLTPLNSTNQRLDTGCQEILAFVVS